MKLLLLLSLFFSAFSQAELSADLQEVQKGFAERGHYGLIPHEAEPQAMMFGFMDATYAKSIDLRDYAEPPAIKNQGDCGSCVYFAWSYAAEFTYRLRGEVLPKLAPQHIMDCLNRDWMCNGSFFTKVDGGVTKKGSVAQESDYPYQARNQSCKGDPAKLYGKFLGGKVIDNSHASVRAALQAKYPLAVTIGAGGEWGNPGSDGVVTGCSAIGTNHEVVIVGMDCGSSVDANGNCVFNSQGMLPAGVGTVTIANSWGTSYGKAGYVTMPITDKSGRRCFNVMEEVALIEVGAAPKPEVPVKFTVSYPAVDLEVVVRPGGPLSVDALKKKIQNTAKSLEAK